MNGLLRFFMGVFAFVTLLVSTGAILTITNTYPVFEEIIAQGQDFFWVLIGVFSFLILLAFILFVASVISRGHVGLFRSATELGEIAISQETIEATILKSARKLDGIRSLEVHSRMKNDGKSVLVDLTYSPFGTKPVQKNATALQDVVKHDLESWLEVHVAEVRVFVRPQTTSASKKQRVV
ncbi:alkaline shock response membrane anchor protein AmaP [Alkalihalobacillus sp. LMS6]|uniref:alkaline shock response membrane anchor protein AmaP n=1 Tax=Bacillaceae TaxID=186817 RepID=UPI000C081BD8|nr:MULTISPECIES: alkaline shock response membrane anchor protein AmaP [Bacillaceae]UTR07599.1 alkaline shock response membrane anchor protein AmaP [Alkalihalobacillus sp. LMS6]